MRKHWIILPILLLNGCGEKRPPDVILDMARIAFAAEYDGQVEARPLSKSLDGVSYLSQQSATSLTYYFKCRPGARLAFGIGQAGETLVHYSVMLQTDDTRPPVRVFEDSRFRRFMRRMGLSRRIAIKLPAHTGIAKVTLSVRTDEGTTGTGVWVDPRIEVAAGATAGVRADESESTEQESPAERIAQWQDANFLIVLLDAAGAQHFGCYGRGGDVSPRIDALASAGVLFKNAHTEAVYTQAAVGSLLTAQYPDRHGSYLKGFGLSEDTRSIAQILKEAGWQTALITASPNASSLYGYNRGFDTVQELYKRSGDAKRLVDAAEVVDASMKWIEEQAGKKFFLYAHVREPHAPHTPPAPFRGRYSDGYEGPFKDNSATEDIFNLVNSGKIEMSDADKAYMAARYDENLAYADAQVGRMLDSLKSRGLMENTVIILVGDHGEAMGEHRLFGHNAHLYQEFSRVPFIIHLPAQVDGKRAVVDEQVGLIDVAPTIVAMAGLDAPPGAFQGRSLVDAFTGAPGAPRSAIHYGRTAGEEPNFGVQEDGFSYVYSKRTSQRQTFDLTSDPAEQRNISEEAVLRTGYMHQQYLIWAEEQKNLALSAPAKQISASADEVNALIELGYADPNAAHSAEAKEEKEPQPASKPQAKDLKEKEREKKQKPAETVDPAAQKRDRKHDGGKNGPSEGDGSGSEKDKKKERKKKPDGTPAEGDGANAN